LSRKYSIKSGWLFDEAQKRLQSLLKEAQQKTEILLAEHWDNLERVVEGLLERKTLDEDEVRALLFPAKS
jgi:ATP-dependent Zn protease